MFFPQTKGIIALDIDGTVTSERHHIDQQVVHSLYALFKDHWKFIFITGRPFDWGIRSLEHLPFPYALAVQNGAMLLEMPSKKILSRKYLSTAILPLLEPICQEQQTDFVIYSGMENNDNCFYRPLRLSPSLLTYLKQRTADLEEKWQPLDSYTDLPISFFSSIKFFAKENQAIKISESIENKLGLHAPPIRDPYNSEYFVIQTTHQEATKGEVLKQFAQLVGVAGPIIAAGDDYNDLSMLQCADVKIVMANAPKELINIADIIAPIAEDQGILYGLSEGLKRINLHININDN